MRGRGLIRRAAPDHRVVRESAPRLAICGAGAVGLVLAARLAGSGAEVLLLTRGREAAARIEREGLRFEDLAGGGVGCVRPAATADLNAAAAFRPDFALLCVRREETAAAADALARAVPRVAVASFQNDVDNEAVLARRFERVIGAVYRQTCTRLGANHAVTAGSGRVILGDHPRGAGPDSRRLAGALEAAGYDVSVSEGIESDLWLKLCVNLMSAPNALVRRDEHESETFAAVKTRLLEEAREVLAAAGITAAPCDGRDRSLDQEIEFQRTARERGASARRLPLYNQVWSSLRSGSALEADAYHRRILDLAARHGVPAPVNARVLAVLLRTARRGLGPESAMAAELWVDG